MKPATDESPAELQVDGLVPLESVLYTEELNRRPLRPPDYQTENRALVLLSQALADSPRTILQEMAKIMLETFRADSAGFSLLTKEDGGKRFVWPAIAGVWAGHIGGGTPRNFGPCGDVLDRNAPLLFKHLERRYTYFQPVTPPAEECLLVPFYVERKAVGTIWVIVHDDRRKFDAEDMRQLVSLGSFASSAYQVVASLETLEQREQTLRQSHTELEQRVVNRTQELVQSHERLRALATELNLSEQRERKRLASELHDHLAQLLVLGQMKLGQSKALTQSAEKRDALIAETDAVLSHAMTYLRTLVADLSPPILYEFGLSPALRWLGEQMQRHELAVTVQIENDELQLPEDQAVLLFQSVRELLMNAVKHAKSGKATVRLEQKSGNLRIEVRDQGAGFEPTAVVVANTNAGVTSKFGLFSIRERMKVLGGRFELHSAPGQGTTATLTLPLERTEDSGLRAESTRNAISHQRSDIKSGSEDAAPECISHRPAAISSESEVALPIAAYPSRPIRVVLVDDHAMMRQGLRSVLESYSDVEVVGEALNGEEAVAAAEALQPSHVVMDINMPKMSGIEATARIKSRYPDIIVIGLSVDASRAIEEAMEQAGAAMLVNKGAAVAELYLAIQTTLSGRRAEREGKGEPMHIS